MHMHRCRAPPCFIPNFDITQLRPHLHPLILTPLHSRITPHSNPATLCALYVERILHSAGSSDCAPPPLAPSSRRPSHLIRSPRCQ